VLILLYRYDFVLFAIIWRSFSFMRLACSYNAAVQAGRPVRGKTGGTRLRNLMALSVIDCLTRYKFVVF
jgi:hypothetical protein